MPTLLFQLITIVSNLVVFIFLLMYLLQLRSKEKEMEKKENKIDTNYHQIVDTALFKERKILEDATDEANQIITGAQFTTQASREEIRRAMNEMLAGIQKEAIAAAHDFITNYHASLKELSTQSMTDFKGVAKELETDLHTQIKDFQASLLPNLEKELEAYKKTRLEQTDQMITRVIQKVAQEVLNKTISLDDHHALMIESLERAKKQGMFG